jgi:hypothetical protein
MQYLIFGREVGHGSSHKGKGIKKGAYHHFQGYVEYKSGKRPSDLNKEKLLYRSSVFFIYCSVL